MKNIAIVTLYGFENYGNRLQNYALQEAIGDLGCNAYSIICKSYNELIKEFIKIFIQKKKGKVVFKRKEDIARQINIYKFDKRYIRTKKYITKNGLFNRSLSNEFDAFIVGSDQVWNPLFWEKESFYKCQNNYLLEFVHNKPKYSYAASFGVDSLNKKHEIVFKRDLHSFNFISVREEEGNKIISKITNVPHCAVLDPVFLLSKEKWIKIEKGYYTENEQFVLIYFLGEQDQSIFENINVFSKENGIKIIDLMDVNSPYYQCGPEVFVELIHKAVFVFTDSFHATSFSIIFNTPFLVFERHHPNGINMDSRLKTLLNKTGISERVYDNRFWKKQVQSDFAFDKELLDKEISDSKSILKTMINDD